MATQTNNTVVYTFRRCPYAIRARLALWYSGITFELREVVLKNKPKALLDASVKGTVPVLVEKSGLVLDESVDIMRWALAQADPDGWAAETLDSSLVERNDDYFKYYLDRYKYFDRYPERPQQDYLTQACDFIAELESKLSSQSRYLIGESPSALDMAIFPFVRQFAFVDKPVFDELPYPKVQQWLATLLDSELFLAVMLKYPAWQSEQEALVINN